MIFWTLCKRIPSWMRSWRGRWKSLDKKKMVFFTNWSVKNVPYLDIFFSPLHFMWTIWFQFIIEKSLSFSGHILPPPPGSLLSSNHPGMQMDGRKWSGRFGVWQKEVLNCRENTHKRCKEDEKNLFAQDCMAIWCDCIKWILVFPERFHS